MGEGPEGTLRRVLAVETSLQAERQIFEAKAWWRRIVRQLRTPSARSGRVAETTDTKIELLSESLAHVDQKVDANNAKIDRLAADTQSMINLAFGNLDRRLRVVEEIVLPQKPS